MKPIQWYPGHMAKAVRMMGEQIKLVDAVLIVLDARCPAASYNPRIADMVGGKPALYVLNKADLAADMGILSAMKAGGMSAVTASLFIPIRTLTSAMEETARAQTARLKEKGVTRPVRFLVAGIPNTGKSTLINRLAGAKKAGTGDKAGVTRGKQWVKCGQFELLDTPGLMPPACENQTLARRLAYVGSINDDILELDEIALALLEELSALAPERLKERYQIETGTPLEMLDGICMRRGFVLRGKEYDYERGVRALLDDLRKGRLGKLCFDTLEDARTAGLISWTD